MIDKGKAIAQGTTDELKDMVGGERIEVKVTDRDDLPQAREILSRVAVGELQGDERLRRVVAPVSGGPRELAEVLDTLRDLRLGVSEVVLRRPTLDDVFLALTGAAAGSEEADPAPAAAGTVGKGFAMRFWSAFGDGLVIARRNLIKLKRVPEVLVFVMVSPIMFVLLFAYVFGSAIDIPGGSYREFLMAGIFGQTVVFGATFTGAGLAEDMQKGIIDRFRSLPMSRAAVVLGRTASDVVYNVITLTIMAITGLIVGWRIRGSLLDALAGFLLLLLFAYSVSWIMALLGLSVPSPEVLNNASFVVIFPLTFIANTFVPSERSPHGAAGVRRVEPDLVAGAGDQGVVRQHPAGTPEPATWPLQNPVIYSVFWACLIIAIFAPLSVRRYIRVAKKN